MHYKICVTLSIHLYRCRLNAASPDVIAAVCDALSASTAKMQDQAHAYFKTNRGLSGCSSALKKELEKISVENRPASLFVAVPAADGD